MQRLVPAELAGQMWNDDWRISVMKKVSVGLVAIVLACAAPAFAAQVKKPVTSTSTTPSHNKLMSLKQADKNNDGYVSRSEADASPALSKQFTTLDSNSDGKLSAQEYAKHK
jgi:uncharacterized lipoprotein YajG